MGTCIIQKNSHTTKLVTACGGQMVNNYNTRRFVGAVLLKCNVDVLLNWSCLSWNVIGRHNFGTKV